MKGLKNKENITVINMRPSAICRCRIGGDLYTNQFEVIFDPDESYPDYMEVNKWILENIDGKDLNIEEAVELLFQYLMEYEPRALEVTSVVEDVKTHFPVTVSKFA